MIDSVIDVSGKENEIIYCRFVKDGVFINWFVGYKKVVYVYV